MAQQTEIKFPEFNNAADIWKYLRTEYKKLADSIAKAEVYLSQGSAEPEIGDHLVSPRWNNVYTHHGVYVGDLTVIHYAGGSGSGGGSSIQKVDLREFAGGSEHHGFIVCHHPRSPYTADEIIERAHSRLGEDDYSLASNNCEHFANWVIEGEHKSRQVDSVTAISLSTGKRGVFAFKGASIGRFFGLSAYGFASVVVNGVGILSQANENAAAARERSKAKLSEARQKTEESEVLRQEINEKIQGLLDSHFAELDAIHRDYNDALDSGKPGKIGEIAQAFLAKLGIGRQVESFDEFKRKFDIE